MYTFLLAVNTMLSFVSRGRWRDTERGRRCSSWFWYCWGSFLAPVAQFCMGTCMWAHPVVPCLRGESEESFDELTALNLQPHCLTSLSTSMRTPLTPDRMLPLQWLDSALGLLLYTTGPDPHTAFSHTDLQSMLFPTLDNGSRLTFSSTVFLPSSLSLMLTGLDSFISAAFSSTWLSLGVYSLPRDSTVAWLSTVLIPVLIKLSSTWLL